MKYLENIGVFLLIGIWIILAIWGVLMGVLESKSLFASASIVVIWGVILILLTSAIVRRYKESKSDPYKDVEI